jgi:hypothetical protein
MRRREYPFALKINRAHTGLIILLFAGDELFIEGFCGGNKQQNIITKP